MRDTPETSVAEYYIRGEGNFVRSDICRKMERERNEAREEWGKASMDAAQLLSEKTKVMVELDEAREKIKRQASRIRELEGATNHAGGIKKSESPQYHGTPETDAMVERWQNSHIPADFSRRMETERNEAHRLADTRLTQLLAITSSEPKDYLGLAVACRVHKDHIAQLIKERDEARDKMADALQEIDLRTLDFERMKQERDEAREVAAKWEAVALREASINGARICGKEAAK